MTEILKERLRRLELLLKHLPKESKLPNPTLQTTKYPFHRFVVDPELVERTGAENGALNEQLKQVFGWRTCTMGDGT